MKKTVLLVFAGLMIACLPVFAGGIFDSSGGPAQSAPQNQVPDVADVVDVVEVPVRDYAPRQNPGVHRATSQVYALPANSLAPEPERLPSPVYAISGVKGQEIREGAPEVVDVVIDLPEKETFSRGLLEGEDVASWIQNLPKGLEARAHKAKKDATSIRIYISGTPEETMREIIRVRIPGTYLTSGNSISFVSPTEEESFTAWQAGQVE
jgi:hypothetical protein